jgi:hypothetical protein
MEVTFAVMLTHEILFIRTSQTFVQWHSYPSVFGHPFIVVYGRANNSVHAVKLMGFQNASLENAPHVFGQDYIRIENDMPTLLRKRVHSIIDRLPFIENS